MDDVFRIARNQETLMPFLNPRPIRHSKPVNLSHQVLAREVIARHYPA